jgi:hypothetical protein
MTSTPPPPAARVKRSEFASARRTTTSAPEFEPQKLATATRARSAFAASTPAAYEPPRRVEPSKPAAPEFAARESAPEFGP